MEHPVGPAHGELHAEGDLNVLAGFGPIPSRLAWLDVGVGVEPGGLGIFPIVGASGRRRVSPGCTSGPIPAQHAMSGPGSPAMLGHRGPTWPGSSRGSTQQPERSSELGRAFKARRRCGEFRRAWRFSLTGNDHIIVDPCSERNRSSVERRRGVQSAAVSIVSDAPWRSVFQTVWPEPWQRRLRCSYECIFLLCGAPRRGRFS